VEEAINHYSQFAKRAFSERKWKGQDGVFKATNMEKAVKDTVRSSGLEGSTEEWMIDTRTEDQVVCKT
jgi:hypothetical protein